MNWNDTIPGMDDLTYSEVFQSIPHDAGAVLVFVLVAVSVYLIWRGSRGRTPHGPAE